MVASRMCSETRVSQRGSCATRLHELRLRAVVLGERLGRGVALEEHVEREQAHARQVPPALQRRKAPRHADARQQLEPAAHACMRVGVMRPALGARQVSFLRPPAQDEACQHCYKRFVGSRGYCQDSVSRQRPAMC